MKTPIEVFSDWVDIGKDEGMEKEPLHACNGNDKTL